MIFNIKFSIIITSKFLLYFYICLDKQKQIIMSINKVTIVGIKGFKGSGKDTVASMISYILHDGIMKANYDTWLLYHKNGFVENDEIIIHFADKLKDDIAAFCGIASSWIGFRKQSVIATIVASCIIMVTMCQIVAMTFFSGVAMILLLAGMGIITFLAVESMLSQARKMEI